MLKAPLRWGELRYRGPKPRPSSRTPRNVFTCLTRMCAYANSHYGELPLNLASDQAVVRVLSGEQRVDLWGRPRRLRLLSVMKELRDAFNLRLRLF
jgi:hypothetical protein